MSTPISPDGRVLFGGAHRPPKPAPLPKPTGLRRIPEGYAGTGEAVMTPRPGPCLLTRPISPTPGKRVVIEQPPYDCQDVSEINRLAQRALQAPYVASPAIPIPKPHANNYSAPLPPGFGQIAFGSR